MDASVSLTVDKYVIECEWPQPLFLYDGMPLGPESLNCKALLLSDCVFTYNFAMGTILSIGEHILKVHVASANESCVPVELEVKQIIRSKIKTSITWNPPSDIRYPSPLTRVQLNAYVSGAFPGR